MIRPDMKPGDLVKLKSGGPVMTLGSLTSAIGQETRCFWFVGLDLKSALFPLDALVKSENHELRA